MNRIIKFSPDYPSNKIKSKHFVNQIDFIGQLLKKSLKIIQRFCFLQIILMNTQQRLILLRKFSTHIQQKLTKIQIEKNNHLKTIQNYDVNLESLPKIQILNDLAIYHDDINKTINETFHSIQGVTKNLQSLKNRKENTGRLQDALASISLVKEYSITLKGQNFTNLLDASKAIKNYYQIRSKVKYCDAYIKQIDEQIDRMQMKYRSEFDAQLTKTNSESIKDLSKILEIIKTNKKKFVETNQLKESVHSDHKQFDKLKRRDSLHSVESLSQISEFYVTMAKKQLAKFEEELFNIPIVSPTPNQASYLFFDIIKNSLKVIATIIQTYSTNIIKLESLQGLHQVIVHVFKYAMESLVFEILVREKKYFEIDKITISRNKLGIKASQYKVLKNYFKEFNAIWNQIERFRTHLYSQLEEKNYDQKDVFNKELIDIINSSKLVEFNSDVILYFQAFLRHQFEKLLKKNPFILSLWQLDETFFKDVKLKNQFKSNLSGHDFVEEMITKFSEGIKKSFETLNVLIVSALINFVSHNLICDDSFFAFNELVTRFLNKIADPRSIQGIMILMNTVSTYPKAIKLSFEELQIPQELPEQRIKNQISQLVHSCKQKTAEFITETFDKILSYDFITEKITSQANFYQDLINKIFLHFQKDLLELFVYKVSKVHVQHILQDEFKQKYSHMDVLALEKKIRTIINFYESKSHSIRQNFRKILDYIEVLLVENQNGLKKLIEEWKGKYEESQLINIWKLRSEN